MTSFRRLVIAVAEAVQVLLILGCTLWGGVLGATSGTFRSMIMSVAYTDVRIEGIGNVATVGGVFGFIIGAICGFVAASTLAGTLFALVQIERNTRGLLEEGISAVEAPPEPRVYRAEPRF